MRNILFLAGLIGVLTACNNTPYGSELDNVSPNRPTVIGKPPAPYYLSYRPQVLFSEEVKGDFTVVATLPTSAGDPVFVFTDLPQDAVVTQKGNEAQVTWKPKMGDGMDSLSPTRLQRSYVVSVGLRGTKDSKIQTQGSFVLSVNHKSRGLNVTGFDSKVTTYEGRVYERVVHIASQDFPHGPFTVDALNLPVGVSLTIAQNDPTQVLVHYAPDYWTVTYDSGANCRRTYPYKTCAMYNWALRVLDPRGEQVVVPTQWMVMDVRLNPTIWVEPTLTARGNQADFYLRTDNPNGDDVPTVSTDRSWPGIPGQISFTVVKSSPPRRFGGRGVPQEALIHVVWTVPDSVLGTVQKLNIKACVADDRGQMALCPLVPVQVQF